MFKFYCKTCDKNYYSSSEDAKCSVCDSQMEIVEMDRPSKLTRIKNKITNKWRRR